MAVQRPTLLRPKKVSGWRCKWQLLGAIAIAGVCYWQVKEEVLLNGAVEPTHAAVTANFNRELAELKAVIASSTKREVQQQRRIRELETLLKQTAKPKTAAVAASPATQNPQTTNAQLEEKQTTIDQLKRDLYSARKTALQIEKAVTRKMMLEVRNTTDSWRREAGEKVDAARKDAGLPPRPQPREKSTTARRTKLPIPRKSPKKNVLSHTPCLIAQEIKRTNDFRTNYAIDDRNLDACKENQTAQLREAKALVFYSHEAAEDQDPFCKLAEEATALAGVSTKVECDYPVIDALGEENSVKQLVGTKKLGYITTTEHLPPPPWGAVKSEQFSLIIGVRHPVTTLLMKFPDPKHNFTESDLGTLPTDSLTRHLSGVGPDAKIDYKTKNLAVNRLKRASLVLIQEWKHESMLALCAALGWNEGGWGNTLRGCMRKAVIETAPPTAPGIIGVYEAVSRQAIHHCCSTSHFCIFRYYCYHCYHCYYCYYCYYYYYWQRNLYEGAAKSFLRSSIENICLIRKFLRSRSIWLPIKWSSWV
jgi:hypothetical protein